MPPELSVLQISPGALHCKLSDRQGGEYGVLMIAGPHGTSFGKRPIIFVTIKNNLLTFNSLFPPRNQDLRTFPAEQCVMLKMMSYVK